MAEPIPQSCSTSRLTKMREDLASNPLHLREIVAGTRKVEDKIVDLFCNERFYEGNELGVRPHFDTRSIVRKFLALACSCGFGFCCRFTVYQVDAQVDRA